MKNCLICNNIQYDRNIVILNLTESYCESCLIEEIKTRTQGVLILNEYEKSKNKHKHTRFKIFKRFKIIKYFSRKNKRK